MIESIIEELLLSLALAQKEGFQVSKVSVKLEDGTLIEVKP